jgi:hypothetical protein
MYSTLLASLALCKELDRLAYALMIGSVVGRGLMPCFAVG